jgi:hypothetical protein
MINQTYVTATSFAMFIPGDEYAGLQMKITDFEIPTVTSDAVDQGTIRLQAKHPGSQLSFEPLTVNVLADGGLTNIIPVHNWLVNNVVTKDPERKDLRLIGYAANETQLFTVDFRGAFPTTINIDKFDAQDSNDSVIKANITFAYDYYEYG